MASSNEGRARGKEKRKLARLDIFISKENGYLEILVSLAASSHSSEAYREPIRAVEVVHSVCQKPVTFEREQTDAGMRSVISCKCGLRLEFSSGAVVTTVGELDRELKNSRKNFGEKRD